MAVFSDNPALRGYWHAVARSSDVPGGPLKRTILHDDVVIWRGPDGAVVGVAGLERYDRFGLLRSVAVSGSRRGEGLGARLTAEVLSDARRRGLAGVWALTTTAADYFPRLGFEVVDRSEVPEPVRRSAEFCTICPASAVALSRRLDDVA